MHIICKKYEHLMSDPNKLVLKIIHAMGRTTDVRTGNNMV